MVLVESEIKHKMVHIQLFLKCVRKIILTLTIDQGTDIE